MSNLIYIIVQYLVTEKSRAIHESRFLRKEGYTVSVSNLSREFEITLLLYQYVRKCSLWGDTLYCYKILFGVFSPHRGDVLCGLPDSYSVRRACHLPPLSLGQGWWDSSGLAIHLSLCPRPCRQLGPLHLGKFGSRIGRNEPLLAEVSCNSFTRSKVYIRPGVGTGMEQKCDVSHMSNTIPWLSCGTPLPTLSGWLCSASPDSWSCLVWTFQWDWGLPSSSRGGYSSC